MRSEHCDQADRRPVRRAKLAEWERWPRRHRDVRIHRSWRRRMTAGTGGHRFGEMSIQVAETAT